MVLFFFDRNLFKNADLIPWSSSFFSLLIVLLFIPLRFYFARFCTLIALLFLLRFFFFLSILCVCYLTSYLMTFLFWRKTWKYPLFGVIAPRYKAWLDILELSRKFDISEVFSYNSGFSLTPFPKILFTGFVYSVNSGW